MSTRRWQLALKPVALAAVLVFVTVWPNFMGATNETIAITAGVWIIIASSWNMIGGLANLYSFGQAAFVGIGSYVFAYLAIHTSLPMLALLLASGLGGAITSLLIVVCFRTRGIYFSIMTLALAEALRVVANEKFPGTTGGLSFIPPIDVLSHQLYWWVEACAVVTVFVSWLIRRGSFGLALGAVRGDIEAAEAAGVNSLLVRVRISIVAAALAGVAGGLLAATTFLVVPNTNFSSNYSILPVLMVALGGLGTVYGPVCGAILWTLMDHVLSSANASGGAISTLLYGVVLVLLAVFLPQGLAGLWSLVLRHTPRLPVHVAQPRTGVSSE